VHVDVHVQAVRQVRSDHRDVQARGRRVADGLSYRRRDTGGPYLVYNGERTRELALADVDTARERTGVVVYAVVGNLQVVRPAVDEEATTALRAVSDC
jgi:hypothetical protein